MFNNIGKKIKTLAQVITWIGIIASIIGGIAMIAIDKNFILFSLIIIVVGSFVSWLSSFILYGFGQLIDNSDKLVQAHGLTIDYSANKTNTPYEKLANLENLRAKGLITEEEYQAKKNNF